MQILVDADNIAPGRIALVATAVTDLAPHARWVVSGRPHALDRTDWPDGADLRPAAGWQSADIVLAQAYRADAEPLVLVTGDGDFALLAARHGGPVLVISGAASRRFVGSTVTDPAVAGPGPLRAWLIAVRDQEAVSE